MQRRVTIDLDDLDDVTLSVVASVDGVPLRRVVEKALTNYLAGRRRYPPIERAVRSVLASRHPHATHREYLTRRDNAPTISGVDAARAPRPVSPAYAGRRDATGPEYVDRNKREDPA
jgi:hypothetical protein